MSSITTADKSRSEKTPCSLLYEKACRKLHLIPLPVLTSGYVLYSFRQFSINLCLDSMQRQDLDPLLLSLPQMTVLTSIQFTGEAFQEVSKDPSISQAALALGSSVPNPTLKPGRKPIPAPNPWDKTASAVASSPGDMKLSRWSGVTVKLTRALAVTLQNSLALAEVRLVGLKLGKLGWKGLAEGLVATCPVEYLAVNYCKMDDAALEIVTPGLKSLERLRKLDISNNQLSDKCGFFLSRLINLHCFRKDEISWLNNLRSGASTPASASSSLQEICIANNKVSDKSVFDLCHALSFDSCVQALDLRRNPISEEGGRELVSMVRSNSTMLLLDIRETGLRDIKLLRELYKKLHRNIDHSKASLSAKRTAEYLQKLREAEQFTTVVRPSRHIESISFPNEEITHDLQAEDMLGSYLSDSPKDRSAVQKAKCTQCRKMERQLLRSESQCVALKLANRSLRSSIKPASRGESQHRRVETLMAELSELIEHMEET